MIQVGNPHARGSTSKGEEWRTVATVILSSFTSKNIMDNEGKMDKEGKYHSVDKIPTKLWLEIISKKGKRKACLDISCVCLDGPFSEFIEGFVQILWRRHAYLVQY